MGAAGVLRVEVRATPAGLVVCNGLGRRMYPWEDIEGFRILEKGSPRGVYVLVGPDQVVNLPIANSGLLITRHRELRRVREALENYRLSRP